MVQNETFFESHDRTKLFLYRWLPQAKPRAVVHIVHGMAEHALRYKRLAERFTGAGIEVWAADQRGHGRTADINVNKPSKGGLLGHCSDGYSFLNVTKDIYSLNKEIRKTTDVPVFLLGHSWGSIITRFYMEEYSVDPLVNGYILSGTMGLADIKMKAGLPFLVILALLMGQRSRSSFVKNMGDGQYNKPFMSNRTEFDWLSRDTEEVDKYIFDPLCGNLCSIGFYRDITRTMVRINRNDKMEKINRSLPVYVFSGSADPVGGMGAGPTKLVNAFHKFKIKDIEFVLYPGARHELLNETNREEVMDNLLSWIDKRC